MQADLEEALCVPPQWPSYGLETLRKLLGCKEHLDWLKKDLNTAEISTLQNQKHKNVNGCTHIQW